MFNPEDGSISKGYFAEGKFIRGTKSHFNGNKEHCHEINNLHYVEIREYKVSIFDKFLGKDIFTTGKVYDSKMAYSGGLKNNTPHGHGKMINHQDGSITEGYFANGNFIKGTRLYLNGDEEHGIFKNNNLFEGATFYSKLDLYIAKNYRYVEGRSYYGCLDFKDNPCGYGILINRVTNEVFEGIFGCCDDRVMIIANNGQIPDHKNNDAYFIEKNPDIITNQPQQKTTNFSKKKLDPNSPKYNILTQK